MSDKPHAFDQIRRDVAQAVRQVIERHRPLIRARKVSRNLIAYYVSEGAKDGMYARRSGR